MATLFPAGVTSLRRSAKWRGLQAGL